MTNNTKHRVLTIDELVPTLATDSLGGRWIDSAFISQVLNNQHKRIQDLEKELKKLKKIVD